METRESFQNHSNQFHYSKKQILLSPFYVKKGRLALYIMQELDQAAEAGVGSEPDASYALKCSTQVMKPESVSRLKPGAASGFPTKRGESDTGEALPLCKLPGDQG